MIDLPPSRFRNRLLAITAGAAVLRLAVFFAHYRNKPFGFNDAEYYSMQAIALAGGRWFIDPATGAPGAEHGPLTTVLVFPVSWIDQPQNWQRLVTVVVGIAAVFVIGLAGRALGRDAADGGTRLGLIAAAIAAVYPNLWLNDGLVMSESLTAFLVAAWILLGLRLRDRPVDLAWLIGFGAVGGLAALARSELVLLALFGAAMVWWLHPERRARVGAVVLGATALVLAPWVGPNLVRFDTPVVLSTNAGTTLRGANCDSTYSGREIGSWTVFCLVIDPETVRTETSRRDLRWRSDGLQYAGDHLDRVPVVVLARVGRTLDLFGLDYQLDEDVRDGRPRAGSMLGIAMFWILAPLAAVGIVRRRGVELALLLAPIAVVAITTVMFYGGHRIRAPLEPVVVLGAASALAGALSRPRH